MSRPVMVLRSLRQIRQKLNATDGSDVMEGVVTFDLMVDDRMVAQDVSATVNSSAGATFVEVFEVSWPANYEGPRLQYDGYRACVEGYVRSIIGPSGHVIKVGPGASDISFKNVAFSVTSICPCELAGDGGAW